MSDRTHVFWLLPAFHLHILFPCTKLPRFLVPIPFFAPLSVRLGYATDYLKHSPHYLNFVNVLI
jgi:hypothetical protein